MPLTPADVQNVVFTRPRIGRRGYREDEVDIFLDLVADELTRHIQEKDDLRRRNAALRERNALLEKATADLRDWDAELRRRRDELRRHEDALRQQAAQLRRYKAALQKAAEQRELEAPREQRQAALPPRRADVVRQRRTMMPARQERQPAAVSEEQRITAVRSIAGAFGKHDLEWMAIKSVAERVGQGMTETVQQEWTRKVETERSGGDVIPIESAQLQQLRQQNSELTRVNDMLKTLTALFAAEMGATKAIEQGQIGS